MLLLQEDGQPLSSHLPNLKPKALLTHEMGPRFKYTPGCETKTSKAGTLSPKQREFYEKNGFLVIPKLIPDDLIDACHRQFLDVIDGRIPKGTVAMIF